jgi:hypothetical protein
MPEALRASREERARKTLFPLTRDGRGSGESLHFDGSYLHEVRIWFRLADPATALDTGFLFILFIRVNAR